MQQIACARLLEAHIRTGMFWPKTMAEHVARHGAPRSWSPATVRLAPKPKAAPVKVAKAPEPPTPTRSLIMCNERIEEHLGYHSAVISGICRKCGVSTIEVFGAGRKQPLVVARRRIAKILRRRGYSLNAIGRVLGGRDHSTILHYLGRKRRAA